MYDLGGIDGVDNNGGPNFGNFTFNSTSNIDPNEIFKMFFGADNGGMESEDDGPSIFRKFSSNGKG